MKPVDTWPSLDDFRVDAERLAILLLSIYQTAPTEAELLLVQHALRAQWQRGWVAHAQSVPTRRQKRES
jgi:hypothetical protein